jgi:hypothetical protein
LTTASLFIQGCLFNQNDDLDSRAMIVMGLILAMIDEYEVSKIMKKRPQWMKDKDKEK